MYVATGKICITFPGLIDNCRMKYSVVIIPYRLSKIACTSSQPIYILLVEYLEVHHCTDAATALLC